MHRRLGSTSVRDLITTDAPSFGAALATAELLYKFGSFTLEALAFVATWIVIGWVLEQVMTAARRRRRASSASAA